MKIVLVGASGFVGTRILDLYKHSDFDLVNYDVAPSEFYPDITIIGDVLDKQKLSETIKNTDCVILLAAQHRDDVTPVSLYYDVNVQGLKNVLKAMEENNCKRLLFFSSVAVYGLDKETLLKNYKVFCIPSTIEGLAITLLEAMSYAKPVIASDIEANKEGLGENGIWVKAEDEDDLCRAINYCEDNIDILEKEAEKNYNRIETMFTWDRISQLYSNYIKSIIKD